MLKTKLHSGHDVLKYWLICIKPKIDFCKDFKNTNTFNSVTIYYYKVFAVIYFTECPMSL